MEQEGNVISRKSKCAAWITLAIGIVFLLLPPEARCQATGTLTGTVRDQSGAIVPRAIVTVTNEATKAHWTTATTSAGLYVTPNLPPGDYDLAVSGTGFRQFIQSGIGVTVGSTATANVVLQIGKATQSVSVRANAPLLQTTNSEVGTTVQADFIAQLPLEEPGGVRDPLQFIELTPGFAGNVADSPSSQLSFKVNGGQEGGSEILVDGASIQLTHPNLQQNYGVGVDAISQFKVITGSFPAQYGRATGGLIDIVLKSGTDQIHGSAYDYVRNSTFNAAGFMTDYDNEKKGPDDENDFGFSLGGPAA
jgi:Carboxypeptidase regulatory-like domain/TonB-dependent Receptor Plug Domain